jgi:ABC-2 type transport system permease protein
VPGSPAIVVRLAGTPMPRAISGVFFVSSDLPPWMQTVASVFPLKWLAQGMRSVFLPSSFESAEVSGSWQHGQTALVLAVWAVVGLVLALWTFRWTREPG